MFSRCCTILILILGICQTAQAYEYKSIITKELVILAMRKSREAKEAPAPKPKVKEVYIEKEIWDSVPLRRGVFRR